MGIDGRLLMGDGIWLNCSYLPKEWIDYLDKLWEKYPYLMESDRMDGLSNDSTILFWGQEPVVLFPKNTYNRRPLIINKIEQLKLMKPSDKSEDLRINQGVALGDEKIWNPSYENFEIQLNDYYDKVDQKKEQVVNYLLNSVYEVYNKNSRNQSKTYLTQEEKDNLRTLLLAPGYSLVGEWLIYHAD